MDCKPFISVVIPSFNRARLSVQAVESVLRQTYSNFEIVFVDDGSNDHTDQRLAAFVRNSDVSPEKVRYFFQKNQGQSAARNKGIREARGDWIAFLDSDDTWLEEKLESQVRAIERHQSQCGAYYTDAKLLTNSGRDLTAFQAAGLRYEQKIGIIADSEASLARAFGGPWVQTLLARTDLVRKTGGFDAALKFAEDHDFLFRLSRATNYCYINSPLAIIDRSGSPDIGAVRPWENAEVRLKSRQMMFEKWLQAEPPLRETVRTAVLKNLKGVHSEWANLCLERGHFKDARYHLASALGYQATLPLIFKWLLAATAPRIGRRIVPKSKSYFELT